MSKMPMQWHDDCLRNWKGSVEERRLAMERAKADYERCAADCAEYEAQIAQAKARGLDGFDRERFGKKRG
jgi:hypothetical protein